MRVSVDDLTGDGPPPQDVAIAAYRIAQEAVGNAIRDNEGGAVTLRGAVARDTVELDIVRRSWDRTWRAIDMTTDRGRLDRLDPKAPLTA